MKTHPWTLLNPQQAKKVRQDFIVAGLHGDLDTQGLEPSVGHRLQALNQTLTPVLIILLEHHKSKEQGTHFRENVIQASIFASQDWLC